MRRGQVLLRLYLPVLERELQQQQGNLRQLERDNARLDERDAQRLTTLPFLSTRNFSKFHCKRKRLIKKS